MMRRGSLIEGVYPFGDEWHVKKEIGSGSYGVVYLIEREEAGEKIQSAMKWIPIPDSAQDEATRADVSPAYYDDIANALRSEITLMSKLRGNSHIVSYEDHQIVRRSSGIGTDIYIRMEYLTTFDQYLRSHALRYIDVVRLGIELCEALITCAQYNIIHRDIKPDNIFVSHDGNFKLGDFGIAQRLDRLSGEANRRVGSLDYMAPEVQSGEAYDGRADLYSIGMVLYRLLNEYRAPFLPLPPVGYSDAQEEAARKRRFSGEQLPPPYYRLEPLWQIIQKACMYNPEDRYASASEMCDALNAIAKMPEMDVSFVSEPGKLHPTEMGAKTTKREGPAAQTLPVTNEKTPNTSTVDGEHSREKKTSKTVRLLLIGAALIAAALTVWLVMRPGAGHRQTRNMAFSLSVQAFDEQSVSLQWNDTTPPYTISLYSAGTRVSEQSTDASALQWTALAPNTPYEFTITDKEGRSATAAQKTAESALYDAQPYRLNRMYIAFYNRLALNDYRFDELARLGKIFAQDNGTLVFRAANVQTQSKGWACAAILEKTSDRSISNDMLALRLADGCTFTQPVKVLLTDGFFSCYWPLDELLSQVYMAKGGWPTGEAILTLYTDGRFVEELALTIAVFEPTKE